MDDMIKKKLSLKEQVDSLEQNLSKQIKEKECLLQTFIVFKSESKEKEDKYMENEIDLEKKINKLDNILFKVGQSAQTMHMLTKPQAFYDNIHKQALGYQNPFHLIIAHRIKPTLIMRLKMSKKGKDPEVIKKNISHKPIDYEKLNRLFDDFRKRFTPQQELSAEQAFWLRMSNPTIKPSDVSLVKIEAPKELPKVSLVNESLKKLKFHLDKFDNAVEIRTTPDAHTEGEWGFEHTKAVFNNEIIPFLKSLKDIFNVFNRDFLNEIMEVAFDLLRDALSAIFGLSELKPKRPRHAVWYKDKAILAEAQEVGQILDEEQLAFLADVGVPNGQAVQTIFLNNAAFQTEDLDTYDSDCDNISNAKAVLMANISNYFSDVILEVVQIFLWYLDSGCSKHMTGYRSQLMNFVSKFLGIVKFQERPYCKNYGVERSSAFSMCIRKSKKSSHQPKAEDTNQEKLYLLHMDLCGPMRVASNGKRYILVIVDDYLSFTWVRFLRIKDEAPEAIIKCIKNTQVHLNATVRNVRTDNGT
ncbi:retrovirus-related pol polyprotein from transposon TNT 1-94 [Tanacetum coccineum]